MPWEAAWSACQGLGLDLVVLDEVGEQAFLEWQMLTFYWWIGLSDVATEGEFLWADGQSASGALPWCLDEPDNGDYDDGSGNSWSSGPEDCVKKAKPLPHRKRGKSSRHKAKRKAKLRRVRLCRSSGERSTYR